MMATIITYLTFNGNCREAMTFYQKCLGGKLTFQTVSESSRSANMSRQMKAMIVHASLTNGGVMLMGSDLVDETLIRGNTISMMLNCTNEQEVKARYKKLVKGGKQTHPLAKGLNGTLSGGLIDKFGNHWVLHYPSDKSH